MNMFCPIKPNKNRKSHTPSTRNGASDINAGGGQNNTNANPHTNNNNNTTNRQSDINITNTNNNNNNSDSNSNSNSINHHHHHLHHNTNDININTNNINSNDFENQQIGSIRFVIDHFTAITNDEISVSPGDAVLYYFTSSDGDWSYVACFGTMMRGFVPSSILSIKPKESCFVGIKKLPRSMMDYQHNSPSSHNFHNSLHNLHNHHNSFAHQPHHQSSHNHLHSNYMNHNIPYELKFTPFTRENLGLYLVTNNFVAREENDLSVRPGDYLTVLNKDDKDWYWARREYDLIEGFVPARFICDYEQVKAFLNKGNSTVTMKSSNNNDFHTYINHKPDKESLATD